MIRANNMVMRCEIIRLSDKCYKISQYWLVAGIFIKSRAGTATVVWVGRANKYHQYSFISNGTWSRMRTATVDACTRYASFHRAYCHDVRYRKDLRRLFTFRSSHGTLRNWRFAWWTKTVDYSIFAGRGPSLDCRMSLTWDACVEQSKQTRNTPIKRLYLERNSLRLTLHF